MDRISKGSRISVWVCRDLAGSLIFWLKPSRIYDNKDDEEGVWCGQLHPLGDIPKFETMITDLS